MKIGEISVGSKVQFSAQRIRLGNPIIGTIVRQGDEWVTVKLHHDVAGLTNIWYMGEEKTFRISFLSNIKPL